MVDRIIAERKYDCSDKLGQFLTEDDYDILVTSDTDGYLPASCKGVDEQQIAKIAFKFRKNYFTEQEQKDAYEGLHLAATPTDNRGIAGGPRGEKQGNREWVTDEQHEIINYMKNPKEQLFGEDPIQAIRDKHAKLTPYNVRGHSWKVLDGKPFDFDQWVEETKKLGPIEMAEAAKKLEKERITTTTYANTVTAGVAGWYDRYPRFPYGRETSYTENHMELFKKSFPFLQSLNKAFKELLPWRWANQKSAIDKLDEGFYVPDTVFTTITVNKTFRTAAHYDAGDLETGISNLLVLSNDGDYTGGYLVFPEYRIAVDVRPGDLLLVNNHEIMHGNTQIHINGKDTERISLVCYFRKNMLELGCKQYENLRKSFVIGRSRNKEHPLWRKNWNGVSANMFTSEEWKKYLVENVGLEKATEYEPELFKTENTLENLL